jgi:hypothetical protein
VFSACAKSGVKRSDAKCDRCDVSRKLDSPASTKRHVWVSHSLRMGSISSTCPARKGSRSCVCRFASMRSAGAWVSSGRVIRSTGPFCRICCIDQRWGTSNPGSGRGPSSTTVLPRRTSSLTSTTVRLKLSSLLHNRPRTTVRKDGVCAISALTSALNRSHAPLIPPRHNSCRLLRTQEHGGGDEGNLWHVTDKHSRTGQ